MALVTKKANPNHKDYNVRADLRNVLSNMRDQIENFLNDHTDPNGQDFAPILNTAKSMLIDRSIEDIKLELLLGNTDAAHDMCIDLSSIIAADSI